MHNLFANNLALIVCFISLQEVEAHIKVSIQDLLTVNMQPQLRNHNLCIVHQLTNCALVKHSLANNASNPF